MKIAINATIWSFLILILLADLGCSKKEEEAETPEPSFYVKVKTEAEQKEPNELKTEAIKYTEEIATLELELEKLRTKLQTVPFEEILEEDAKRLEELNRSITTLKKRYDIYLQELKEKGEDTTGLQI
jgi:predicted  nucleic acid-binding Zn-ribbon protein